MAKVVTDDSNYKAIADTIRSYLYEPDQKPMKPSEIPSNIQKAVNDQVSDATAGAHTRGYQEGFTAGEQSGLAEGIEQGKKSEYDRFWDSFQWNGTRRNYQYGFAGRGWNDETFRPKYDIIVTGDPIRMFVNTEIVDLVKILQEQGVVLDTSGVNNVQYLFDSCQQLQTAPHIVCNANATSLFAWCMALKTASIEVNENTIVTSTFHRCDVLENLTVVGVIGKGGMTLQYSTKLSKASITSVVNALSSTTSGLSVTFSKTAVNNAFTTEEWATLAATKSNWTINLV